MSMEKPPIDSADEFYECKDGKSYGNGAKDVVEEAIKSREARRALDAEIARLAALSMPEYETARKEAAEALGFRASILDRLVDGQRPRDDTPKGQGRPLELASPEPWPETVNGIRKYVVLTASDALTVALWAIHTHCFDAEQLETTSSLAPSRRIARLQSPKSASCRTRLRTGAFIF